MLVFLLGAAALLFLVAALLLLRGRARPRLADSDDPNVSWYRQRSAELEADDSQLLEDARLRLLEDAESADNVENAESAEQPRGRFPVAALVFALAVGSALLYWQTGSVEDVLIYRQLGELTPEDGEVARDALLRRIENRSSARPENLQYLGLLGQLYMAGESYALASETFGKLAERAPEDAQTLALAAQARFLAAGRKLDSDAQLLAERALAVNPGQTTALSLLGMASFERGAFAAAVNYWERLLAQEDRGTPTYEMLSEVIAVARERGDLQDLADVAPAVESGPGISVRLALAKELPADPDAVVFVFARRAEAETGMPIAVRRLQAGSLPLTLRLGDDDSMAGQLLSQAGEVLVSAQLSANGQPGLANARYSGSAGPVVAGDEAQITIELRAVAGAG